MIKVSVCIPVYGVEKYIEHCARSLFEQHDPAVEYIFVNDGTPDNSWQVLQDTLQEYPECQKNSKLIDLPQNGGVENARMTGLAQAAGEYIWFVDSDDLIAPSAIKAILLTLQENPVDYLAITLKLLPVGTAMKPVSDSVQYKSLTAEKLFYNIINYQGKHGAVCNIVKRRLTVDHPMLKTNLKIAEDYVMHCCWSIFAESAAILENPVYGYVIRPQSAMNSSKMTSIMQSTRDAMRILADFAETLPENKQMLFKKHLRAAAVRKRMEYFALFFKQDPPPGIPDLLRDQVQVQVSLRRDWRPTALGLRPVLFCDKLKLYKTMRSYLRILKMFGL